MSVCNYRNCVCLFHIYFYFFFVVVVWRDVELGLIIKLAHTLYYTVKEKKNNSAKIAAAAASAKKMGNVINPDSQRHVGGGGVAHPM